VPCLIGRGFWGATRVVPMPAVSSAISGGTKFTSGPKTGHFCPVAAHRGTSRRPISSAQHIR
jgi:hypothetical protein